MAVYRGMIAGVALFALAACQTSAATHTDVAASPSAHAVEGALLAAAERSAAPGLVAGVYRHGALVDVLTWGGFDCAGGGAADPNAAFEIGSISKQMTAIGLLKLWDAGQVDLDASVGTYLTDIPDIWKPVTIRQLLTHTSGVPDYEEAGGYGVYETSPTPQQIFDIVRDRPLDFEPGSRWSYSNTGYVLLSLVIERVSGMQFGDYMRERVFAPLGMTHTFVGGYPHADVRLAQGCRPDEESGGPRIPVRPITEASTFGAGAISSTLQDWALWDRALYGGDLVSERAMQAMLTPVTLPSGESTFYGFGMETAPFRSEPSFQHTGQTQGFVAEYRHFPEHDLSIVVFANTYHGNTDTLGMALMMREMPELSYDRLPATADPDQARATLVRRALRQAVLGEQPADLLDDDTQRFATEVGFAEDRAQMAPWVSEMQGLEYLQEQIVPGADGPRQLYRVTRSDGDTAYFRVGWRDGKLHRLRWDDQ